jgi:hypothetical protein
MHNGCVGPRSNHVDAGMRVFEWFKRDVMRRNNQDINYRLFNCICNYPRSSHWHVELKAQCANVGFDAVG